MVKVQARKPVAVAPTDATSIWTSQNAVFRQVCFASDQSFARKAVRETGTRRCRQNTYASCIRQHRVKEHDVLIGDQGHGVSCGTWCVSVAGEANFAPAWDRKAATIRPSSTWWRPAKASCWRRNFCSRKPWRGCARLRSRRGPWPASWLCPVRIGGGVVQGPSFAGGGRFPEDLRVSVATAEGARRPFQPTLRLRAGASHL